MSISREETVLALSTKIPFTEKDKRLLLDLLARGINWGALIRSAEACQILPLIADTMLAIESERIPKSPLKNAADRRRRSYERNNIILWSGFKELLRRADEKGIPLIPIKGIVLVAMLYEDLGARGTADIDVLVKKEDIVKIGHELLFLGYERGPVDLYKGSPYHHEFIKRSPVDRSIILNVHAHWDLFRSSAWCGMEIKSLINDFWRNARRCVISRETVLSLSPEDLLFEAALELYKDIVYMPNFLLKRRADIARIVRIYEREIDWDRFIRRADTYGLKGLIYCALLPNKEMMRDEGLPEDILSSLKPSAAKRFLIGLFLKGYPSSKVMPSLCKGIYGLFVSEIVLMPNRWTAFFLRCLNYIFYRFRLLVRFLGGVISDSRP